MSYRPYPNADRARRQVARQQAETAAHPHVVMDPRTGLFAEWTRVLTIAAQEAPQVLARELERTFRQARQQAV